MALTLRGNGQVSSDNYGIDSDGSITATGITSTGNVGIGTAPTDRTLTVSDTTSRGIVSIISANTQPAIVLFGDSDADSVGQIRYDNGDNSLAFRVNSTERMRIDSTGAVTKPNQPVVDVQLNATRTSPGPFATLTVNVDKANNWNSSSHRFTAPIAGRYKATLSAYTNYTNSHGYYGIYVNNSGNGMHFNHAGTTAHTMMGYTRIFDLAANDYITSVRSANGGSGMFDLCFMTVELIS